MSERMQQSDDGILYYDFEHDPLAPDRPTTERTPYRPSSTRDVGGHRVVVTERVNAATPFRETGNTDRSSFRRAVGRTYNGRGKSPIAPHADAVYDAILPTGLTRFLAGVAWIEIKNASWPDSSIPEWTHNAWAVTGEGDKESVGRWAAYSSYAAAAAAIGKRLLAKDGPYAGAVSVADVIEIYAPRSENPTDRYIAQEVAEINDLPLDGALPAPPKGKPIDVVGFPHPVYVPIDLRFEIALTPVGPNRPGTPITPTSCSQHETGTPRRGADVRMHSAWQDAGTPGHPDGKVGVHFYTDDEVVIQKIPVSERSIHAGATANGSSISHELCVNADRDAAKAQRNAAVLDAALIRDGLGKDITALRKHNDWWSGTACPAILSDQWEAFRGVVRRLIEEGGIPAPTFPRLPAAMPVEVLTALFPLANPGGPVTTLYLDWCLDTAPDAFWPKYLEHTTLGNGNTWWRFEGLQIFSDPQGKAWLAK